MKKIAIATALMLVVCSPCFSQGKTEAEIAAARQKAIELRMPLLEEDSARISAELQKTQYQGGEAIPLQITFKNVGTKTIETCVGRVNEKVYFFFDIDVTDEGGDKFQILPLRIEPSVTSGEDGWALLPGQTRKASVWLNNLYNLSYAGKYKVVVSKKFRKDGKIITVSSELIKFEITSALPIAEWQ